MSLFPRVYRRTSLSHAGTFGRVLECWDRKNKDYVAIKIVRNVQKYRDAAMIEVQRHAPMDSHRTGGSALMGQACSGTMETHQQADPACAHATAPIEQEAAHS